MGGLCVCYNENDPQTEARTKYMKLLHDLKRNAVHSAKSDEKPSKIIQMSSEKQDDWKTYLEELLEEIDEDLYRWRPHLLKAIEKTKALDDHTYRSNLFWTLYRGGMQKQRCNLYENNCLDALANIVLRVQGTWNKSNRVDNYKSLLKEVRKQFDTPAHPFNILQKEFEDYVVERYSEFIKEDFVSVKEVLVKDISDVIKTLCFVLIKFYQMKLPLTERNADLFLTPMTDLIVKGALRNIVMRVLWVEHENSVVALQKQLAGFQGVKLDKLKVGKFFCFDKSFREQFKRRVGTKPSNRTVLEKSIEAFAKIREINSPNLKLKQLLKVTKKIIKEIDEFWEAYEVKREKLIMDPDSLLSLLIYVIVKSQYSEIYIDHKFLELFITEADKGSTKGYYLVTLGVALDWILEQNPSSFSSGDINLRRSLLTTGQRRSQKTIFVKNKAEPLIQNLAVVEEQKIEEVLESSSREGSELFHTIVTGAELMVDKEISNAFDEFEGVHKKIRRGSQAEEIKGRVPRPTIRDK